MEVEIEREDDLAVVTLPESLQHITPETTQEAEKKLIALIEEPEINRMIIDLNKMEYGGTPVLALLVHIYLKAKRRHKHLRLCDVHPYMKEVLEKTRLDRILEIFESREDALKDF